MWLNRSQLDTLSKYFSDISKILVASIVIGFFAPVGADLITIPVFVGGSLAAIGFLIFSITIAQ